MTKLRLMSSNVWWCDTNTEGWENAGVNCSAITRAVGLRRVYQETIPDVIGFQECSGRMYHQLMTQLVENDMPYTMLWGRDTPIAYRTDKFELVDTRFCIYPEKIPEYEGEFNNLKTKSYNVAVLRVKETGQLLIFGTTHLWYKTNAVHPFSEEAKAWQIARLSEEVNALQEKYVCPAVFVGDFNTWPAGLAVREAVKSGFTHAHDVATEYATDTTGMHYCYGDRYSGTFRDGGFAHSIDHIMVKGFGEGAIKRFERYCPDYFLPISDHSPVWVDVTI